MNDYVIQIISLVITCVIFYAVTELYNYYKRYKFFKKHYFDSKNANDKKESFRNMLDKQLHDAQKQREELLNKKDV